MYRITIAVVMFYVFVFECFEKIASYKMILVLRIISEILGAYRMFPVALFAKCTLDLCIREPLNMCMYSGMIRK